MKIILFSILIWIVLICANAQKKAKNILGKGHNLIKKKPRNLNKNKTKTIFGQTKTNSTKKETKIITFASLELLFKTNYAEPDLVLMGFDKYTIGQNIDNPKADFFMYLYKNHKIDPDDITNITLYSEITNEDSKEYEINCSTTDSTIIMEYKCFINGINGGQVNNIKSIKINDQINIPNRGNVTIPHTSYADYQLKEGINKFLSNNLYKLREGNEVVLYNSRIISSSYNKFIVRGNLTDEKYLNSKGIKLLLMNDGKAINATCNSEANLQKNSNCDLNCTLGKTVDTDLNMTLGFMPDDEYLLIDFDEKENSVVNYTNDPRGHLSNSKKNKKGLSTGGIIAIIIPSILVLLGVTALAIAYKRKTPPTQGVALGNNTIGANISSTNVVNN